MPKTQFLPGQNFVFSTRPKPKRESSKQDDDALNVTWPAGIPLSMLHVHRVYPRDRKGSRKDWNVSSGPLEMYEHIFEVIGYEETSGGWNTEEEYTEEDPNESPNLRTRSNSFNLAAEDSKMPHGSMYPDDRVFVNYTSGPLQFQPHLTQPFTDDKLAREPSIHAFNDPLHTSVLPMMYDKQPVKGPDAHSGTVGQPVNHVPARYLPPDQYRSAGQESYPTSVDASREPSPFSNAFHSGHIPLPQIPLASGHEGPGRFRDGQRLLQGDGSYVQAQHHYRFPSTSNAHSMPSLPNINLADSPEAQYAVQNSNSEHMLPPPRILHPQSALYPVDTRHYNTTGYDERRYSLPSLPNIPPSPGVLRRHHTFMGPNQTSYFAPLMQPRFYPRASDYMGPDDTARRLSAPILPAPPVPGSLAQFPGPLRLSHTEVFPHTSSPGLAHYMETQGSHTSGYSESSSASGSIPPSCATSPSPTLTSGMGYGPSMPLRLQYSTAQRTGMPRRDSWTAHFESLPANTLKIRKRKSRAKVQPEKENVRVNQRPRRTAPERAPSYTLLHQCPLCPRGFERRNGLAIHLKWHYKPEPQPG